jgi:hypothetical protein
VVLLPGNLAKSDPVEIASGKLGKLRDGFRRLMVHDLDLMRFAESFRQDRHALLPATRPRRGRFDVKIDLQPVSV